MLIVEVVSGGVPRGKDMLAPVVRYSVKRGEVPTLPDSMNEKQRNPIHMMTKFEPSNRARVAFVLDKLSEIAQDERASQAP
ncbi:Mitogen-activated protein kinase kinase [Globisporangium polare]